MIKKYSLLALQKAINRALALDTSMPSNIQRLSGKVLEIIIMPLHVNFYIRFGQHELELLAHYEGKPDTIIHSSPIGLIRLSLLPSSKVRSLFNDKIRITGDVELGQQVKKWFDELDIDWEGHLAHFTGDVVAHQIGSAFRYGLAFKRRVSSSVRRQLDDYLHEEGRLFPPAEEINDFFQDVDELSLEVERLEAHINQLIARHEIH